MNTGQVLSMIPGGTNPNIDFASLDPSKNPAGGANPMLPSTSLSSAAPSSSNPLTPTFPANSGGYPSSGSSLLPSGGGPSSNVPGAGNVTSLFGMGDMTSKDLGRLFSGLKKTYGDGTAHMLMNFLTSGAGFNQQAISNLLASLQPGIERGTENLMEQFSLSGNRFGSGAQIGLGDYLSQVNLNEGQLITQMYEQSLNDFMNVMMGTSSKVADNKASSPGGLDSILGGIGLGGQAAGGASSIISALSPAADTGILDAIAGAAAFV